MSAIPIVSEEEKAIVSKMKLSGKTSNPAEQRSLAMHMGELHGLIVKRSIEICESLEENLKDRNSFLKAIEPIMVQLAETCQFSPKDNSTSRKLMETVIDLDLSDQSHSPISKFYEELKTDDSAHPVNIVLASIAHNSYELSRRHSPRHVEPKNKGLAKRVVTADVVGAVVGGIFGFFRGGPAGAAIGAAGIGAGASIGTYLGG
jgi:hypothetical protein